MAPQFALKFVPRFQNAIELPPCRAKGEAIRMKKKLESDIGELDTALEHANGANAEAQRTIKKYQVPSQLITLININ